MIFVTKKRGEVADCLPSPSPPPLPSLLILTQGLLLLNKLANPLDAIAMALLTSITHYLSHQLGQLTSLT